MQRYSKNAEREFDAALRRGQLDELNRCWGAEADEGLAWAEALGFSRATFDLTDVPVPASSS
jgi:hypothetical protein